MVPQSGPHQRDKGAGLLYTCIGPPVAMGCPHADVKSPSMASKGIPRANLKNWVQQHIVSRQPRGAVVEDPVKDAGTNSIRDIILNRVLSLNPCVPSRILSS